MPKKSEKENVQATGTDRVEKVNSWMTDTLAHEVLLEVEQAEVVFALSLGTGF